jgi:magnesium-transporting ATPase (P-type)
VLYTILSVVITHKTDEALKGCGIRHVYIRLGKPGIATEPNIISALMARQAIHIAIALGLLVVIFQNRFLQPKGDASALTDILRQFQTSVAWIVICGFSLSVVLILVSALCYDYSCRFKWSPNYQSSLLRKGLKLDIASWYVFTVSLILSIALVSPLLCILINAGYGFLLLHYYFFDYSEQ